MGGTVEDCVRSHTAWLAAAAEATGGARGREGGIDWAWVVDSATMHLLFPTDPHATDVAQAAALADRLGARETALWSAVDRRRSWLVDLGFRRAWQPWWMTAAPVDVAPPRSDRARVVDHVGIADAARAALLGRPDVVRAEAYVDGTSAGRAWLHLDGDVAGLYDMEVRPDYRRRGIGRDILGTLAAEAARRGARVVTLNATPDGAALYSTCGFARIGEGRTWWRHRGDEVQPAVT